MNYLRKFLDAYVHRGTTVRFQVGCIIVTCIVIFLMLLIKVPQFTSSDPAPIITPLIPKKQSEISGKAAVVKAGLLIRNFSVFDTINNNFVVDAVFWFEFNPIEVSLDIIDKFSFMKGRILKKSDADTKEINGKILARYDVTVQFTTSLDYRFFPFDDHQIFLILVNDYVTPGELIYVAFDSGFIIPESIHAGGMKFADKGVYYGYQSSQLEVTDAKKVISNPSVVFSMDFVQGGIRKLLLILIPLLLMFFISIFSLSLDPALHTTPILNLSMGSLAALFTYRFVIEKMSPDVGYSTISDNLYTLILAACFFIFLMSAYSVRTGKLSPAEKLFRFLIVVALYGAINFTIFYLLFFWRG